MPVGAKQVTVGGAFDTASAAAVNALPDGSLTTLSGTADVIPPHSSGLYVITTGSADLTTLAAPTAGDPSLGGDDGKIIRVVSTTAFAHRVTSTANIRAGIAGVNSITLNNVAGAGMTLMAFNGTWILIANCGALTVA